MKHGENMLLCPIDTMSTTCLLDVIIVRKVLSYILKIIILDRNPLLPV